MTSINAYFNLQSFNVYSVCLLREKADFPQVAFNFITVLMPVISVMVLTNAMDLSSYFWLQNRVLVTRQLNKEGHHHLLVHEEHNNIPLNASVICSLLFIPHLVGFCVVGSESIQPLEKYFLAIMVIRLNDVIRNPLIAKCAFRINDSNAAENRERKRQVEIQDALQRRQERKADNNGEISSLLKITTVTYHLLYRKFWI